MNIKAFVSGGFISAIILFKLLPIKDFQTVLYVFLISVICGVLVSYLIFPPKDRIMEEINENMKTLKNIRSRKL